MLKVVRVSLQAGHGRHKYLSSPGLAIIIDRSAISVLLTPNKQVAMSTALKIRRWTVAPAA